jgi:hypothetical protein
MVFLYPYSLLKKQWGREHKELAYFDLFTGMLVPFLIATTFIVVATANAVGPEAGGIGSGIRDVLELVPVLATTFGEPLALGLIGFGMVAVGVSSIIMHMLAAGFIGCEIFGYDSNSRASLWFAFMPVIGVLGVAYPFPWAMSVTASTLAYPLMPVAVICFIVLLNSKAYMGSERPEGLRRLAWNAVLVFAVVFMIGAAFLALRQNWQDLRQGRTGTTGTTGTTARLAATGLAQGPNAIMEIPQRTGTFDLIFTFPRLEPGGVLLASGDSLRRAQAGP